MKRIIVGSAAVGLLALAGCSTSASDQTPSASAAPSTSVVSKLTAPPVPKPLDVSKFEQNPCGLLSRDQAMQVANLTTSDKSEGNVAPICTWMDSDHNRVTVGFVPGNGGLATVYKNQDNESGYFEVAPDVEGYPAAYFGPHDDRNDGACQSAIGVSNAEVFTVSVDFQSSSAHYSDPCSVVVQAAGAAMTTVKAGA
ncbi:DUF3558 domain-containing protein [Amycolatopsis sp. PS_44_ISF1]|uniref:DUF3558 domain-containing protein n=1 Tax=Amycolatopsis sp. PS_44_ISF1 TaxID=2974917 RepID=UPI0028DFE72F|nr:DUF3558 domain-containing protein [Amycolatopsis sp. PS_44_ISF1]MDT8911314.1 DUF3558 domain-containing protein [Amycolatopsis sp. PS_44_ISF1]